MKSFKRWFRRSLMVLAAGMGLLVVPAQAWMSSDGGMNLSIGAGSYVLSDAVLRSSTRAAGAASGPKARDGRRADGNAKLVPTGFTPHRGVSGLDEMLASMPPSARGAARQDMKQLLEAWPDVAKRLGVPLNDVASGLAAYLVGAHMAYHGSSFPDEQFKTVVQQMKLALQDFPVFARMDDAARQTVYEQFVVLGMLMAVGQSTLEKKPDATAQAQLRLLGERSLESFLRVDAQRVKLTPYGLRID